MDGENGMEGQKGCRKEKRLRNGMHRISQRIAPIVISGVWGRKPARKKAAIICSRSRRQKKRRGTAKAAHMESIPHALGTVLRKSFGK